VLQLISLIHFCYVFQFLYRFLMVINVTSRLLLHIAAYIGVPLNNSALTSGLYTTNCNMLSTSNTKVGAFVLLYFLSFMAFGTQVFLGFPAQ